MKYKQIGIPEVLFQRFEKIKQWFGFRSFSEMAVGIVRHHIQVLEARAEELKDAEIERRKEKTYIP